MFVSFRHFLPVLPIGDKRKQQKQRYAAEAKRNTYQVNITLKLAQRIEEEFNLSQGAENSAASIPNFDLSVILKIKMAVVFAVYGN